MSFPTPLLGLILALFVATRFLRRPKLPPGPKGLPLLGVTKEHPKTEFWKTYQEWGRIYGEYMFIRKRQLWYSLSFEGNIGFISFNVLGRRMVVLNSLSVAEDLLSKRSVVYSDRPSPPMASQLMKRDKSIFYTCVYFQQTWQENTIDTAIIALTTICSNCTEGSCISHSTLQPPKSTGHSPRRRPALWLKIWLKHLNIMWIICAGKRDAHALVFLNRGMRIRCLILLPLLRNAGALTMKIAYGYTIDKHRDYFIGLAEEGMRIGSLSVAPGKWLVDSFPICA